MMLREELDEPRNSPLRRALRHLDDEESLRAGIRSKEGQLEFDIILATGGIPITLQTSPLVGLMQICMCLRRDPSLHSRPGR
mmetsp:Transcript_16963/g.35203  ORF Transcript_16963/g.35203 Transcript_16963/m.35203 type:complete len:82 (-) Transcript_16963:348-593(-)